MSPSQASEPRRTYRACAHCKARKVRCALDHKDGPSCRRCRRMGLVCTVAQSDLKSRSLETTTDRRKFLKVSDAGHGDLAEPSTFTRFVEDPTASSRVSGNDTELETRPYAVDERGQEYLVKRTVRNPTDALNAFLEVNGLGTSPSDQSIKNCQTSTHGNNQSPIEERREINGSTVTSPNIPSVPPANLQTNTQGPYSIWNKCLLVRNNWLRPEDAEWYNKMFFQNLRPMTPIILDFFSNPQTHEFLITQEPFLCYTILTISSQHHNHRRSAQSTPSYAIHEKAWQITKRLCEQILWAEEEGSASRLRTLGTVQALLLLTEFPPRMVHLPPVDIDTITLPDEMAATDQRRDLGFATLEDDERHIQMAKANKWQTELVQPILRSDRISGLLLSIATGLARELGLDKTLPPAWGSTESGRTAGPFDGALPLMRQRYTNRRDRLQCLLYLYAHQLASRTGWTAPTYTDAARMNLDRKMRLSFDCTKLDMAWNQALPLWMRVTDVAHTLSELESDVRRTPDATFRGTKLATMLSYLNIQVAQYQEEFSKFAGAQPFSLVTDILEIELQSIRIHLGSFSVQAVSSRALRSLADLQPPIEASIMETLLHRSTETGDQASIEQVIDAVQRLFSAVVRLSETSHVSRAPIRVVTRIVFASTLMLKALYIVPDRAERVSAVMSAFDAVLNALQESATNDMRIVQNLIKLVSFHQTQIKSLWIPTSPEGAPNRANSRTERLHTGTTQAPLHAEQRQHSERGESGLIGRSEGSNGVDFSSPQNVEHTIESDRGGFDFDYLDTSLPDWGLLQLEIPSMQSCLWDTNTTYPPWTSAENAAAEKDMYIDLGFDPAI